VQFCPENCIILDKKGARGTVDYDYCKGCGICAHECPVKCIDMADESQFSEEKCEDECVLDDKHKI
jgi:pyruvate ferredoxin oxidoreductase delta subunit